MNTTVRHSPLAPMLWLGGLVLVAAGELTETPAVLSADETRRLN